MSDSVVVASTTDTQEEVNAAAGGKPQDAEEPELKSAPTGDEQVESGEPPPAPEPQPDEEAIPKGVQKRIDKFRAQLTAAQKEIEALKSKTNAPVQEEAKPQPEVPLEVAAKFDTFDSWSEKQLAAGKSASLDDFLEARDAWKEARDTQKAQREAVAEYQTEVQNAYQEKVKTFKATVEDWDEVVGQEIDLPPGVGPAILELDNGPQVAYYLGTHAETLGKLNEMSPYLALAEVGRIAARLEKAAPAEQETNNVSSRSPDRQPTVSRAPAPIAPLKGGGLRPSRSLSDPDISYADYRAIRDAEEKKRFRR
jgi:hypothetical protein